MPPNFFHAAYGDVELEEPTYFYLIRAPGGTWPWHIPIYVDLRNPDGGYYQLLMENTDRTGQSRLRLHFYKPGIDSPLCGRPNEPLTGEWWKGPTPRVLASFIHGMASGAAFTEFIRRVTKRGQQGYYPVRFRIPEVQQLMDVINTHWHSSQLGGKVKFYDT